MKKILLLLLLTPFILGFTACNPASGSSPSSQTNSNSRPCVTYKPNGAKDGNHTFNLDEGETQFTLHGDSLYSRTDWTLLGWNTSADGSGTSYSKGQTIPLTENLTLYAQWKFCDYLQKDSINIKSLRTTIFDGCDVPGVLSFSLGSPVTQTSYSVTIKDKNNTTIGSQSYTYIYNPSFTIDFSNRPEGLVGCTITASAGGATVVYISNMKYTVSQ